MRTHGKIATYMDGCRCEACVLTKATENTRQKLARQAAGLPEGDRRHGVNGYSNYGCRCHICRVAWRRKNKLAGIRLKRAMRLGGSL